MINSPVSISYDPHFSLNILVGLSELFNFLYKLLWREVIMALLLQPPYHMVQPVQVLHHLPKQYHNIVSPVINAYSTDYTPTVPLFILARLETAMIKAPFTFLLKLCHPVQTHNHDLQKYQVVKVEVNTDSPSSKTVGSSPPDWQ